MSVSWKATAFGLGLTAGAVYLMHNNLENEAEEREETHAALMSCAEDLGKTGCLDLVEQISVEPESTDINRSQVVITYDPSDIRMEAEASLENDEEWFENIIPPVVAVFGIMLTFGMQNSRFRRMMTEARIRD